jgi:hypothetical protein
VCHPSFAAAAPSDSLKSTFFEHDPIYRLISLLQANAFRTFAEAKGPQKRDVSSSNEKLRKQSTIDVRWGTTPALSLLG